MFAGNRKSLPKQQHRKILTHPWLRIAIFILFLLLCYLLSYAEHSTSLAWMQGYKGAQGVGCCSELDCKEAAVSLIPREENTNGNMQKVRVNGVEFSLPKASVHVSETASGYWCYRSAGSPPGTTNTRCVFYAIGG